MKLVVVGVSDCRISDDADTALVTYALGSCIAVSIWDPLAKAGGMLHFMLPESSLDADKARQHPCMFGDTGIAEMLRACAQKGLNPKRCEVRLAGGARSFGSQGVFEIGKRNYLAARKVLCQEGLLITGEAVGGEVSRTVRLDIGAGRFWLREAGAPEREWTGSGNGVALCR